MIFRRTFFIFWGGWLFFTFSSSTIFAKIKSTTLASQYFQVTVGSIKVKAPKGKIEEHSITSWKNSKKISELKLNRFLVGAEVRRLERVKDAQVVLVDYYKGSDGSMHTKDCSDIILYSLDAKGRLKEIDKLEYRCETNSQEDENDSFQIPYEIIATKDGKASIRHTPLPK